MMGQTKMMQILGDVWSMYPSAQVRTSQEQFSYMFRNVKKPSAISYTLGSTHY